MKRLAIGILLLGLLMAQDSAWAVLTSASVNPSNTNLATSRSTSITVTWSISASTLNNFPVTASSSRILITNATQSVIYGTINRNLSRSIAPGATITLSETIQIPRSLTRTLQRALDAGNRSNNRFLLLREFSDNNIDFVTAAIDLHLTGAGGNLLEITRLALTFDDLSTMRVVTTDQPLHALLDIRFSGSGVLRGTWELATPASTLGEPIFSPLRLVRQSLIGNQVTRIESPSLPTDREGVYLLRFSLSDPDVGFDPVYIRYVVTAVNSPILPSLKVQALAPAEGALISADTLFQWQADSEPSAWQLEIHDAPEETAADRLPDLGTTLVQDKAAPILESKPMTGMLLPGTARDTRLSRLVQEQLISGHGYWWRLLAIDAEGRIIGQTPPKAFRLP